MEQIWDCIVIGGGPAGLSAALNLRRRGRTVLVLSGGAPLLEKAELVDNYLGMPGVTGKEMMERFRAHTAAQGAVLKAQRAGNVITLSLEHREDAAWFLLRLHGEKVTEVAGGSFEEIEDGVYLILAEEDEVSVEVQTGETWQYQDGGKRGDGT